MTIRLLAGAAVPVLLTAAPVLACPICDSDTGVAVREGILDQSLGRNLAAVALPAGAVGAVVGVIHFGGRETRRKGRQT